MMIIVEYQDHIRGSEKLNLIFGVEFLTVEWLELEKLN